MNNRRKVIRKREEYTKIEEDKKVIQIHKKQHILNRDKVTEIPAIILKLPMRSHDK